MAIPPIACGFDFGTSNSAIGHAAAAQPALIPLQDGRVSIPTAVFFSFEDASVTFGREAVLRYLQRENGRLLRSLKSLLGSSLIYEQTQLGPQRLQFDEIISLFLRYMRSAAGEVTSVVIGRPVHFVDGDEDADKSAEDQLRHAAKVAGFKHIEFQLEPIAAALDYERHVSAEELAFVVDIGGGTSDFSVVRVSPERRGRPDRKSDILAFSGVHIGGTDFDHRLSLEQVMPLLGYRHLGPDGRGVPSRVFFDLATWHLIHRLSTQKALAEAQALWTNYSDVGLHRRLMRVLTERHGHHIAHAVEQVKIRCSQFDSDTVVDLAFVEPALAAPMTTAALREQLDELLQRTVACARECVRQAGVADGQLAAIYLTGGSSALRPLQRVLQAAFAGVPLVEGDLFGGVASGLAYSG